MTGSTRPELADRPRSAIPVRAPSRRRWRIGVVLSVTFGLVAVAIGGLSALRDAAVPTVGEVAVVSASTDRFAVDYSDAPSVEFVTYGHGQEVSYAVQLRNDGPIPVTVEDVPVAGMEDGLRLIRPTEVLVAPEGAPVDDPTAGTRPFEPFRLDPGARRTVIVDGVFDNCVYYTERAMDVITSQAVTWRIAGWSTTTEVELPRQLAVRSPHIRDCPDRMMDRGARTRTSAS